MELIKLDIGSITQDPRTQPRAIIDEYIVNEYRLDMMAGDQFPPLVVFSENGKHYLADGWHRLAAAKQIGATDIDCAVKAGTIRDAILYSCSVNAGHGKRRTNGDKERAVKKLLNDPEWVQWNDHEIARRCNVTHPFVGKLRSSLVTVTSEKKYITKHGTVATMKTGKIGKPKTETVLLLPLEPVPAKPKYDPLNYRVFTSPVNSLTDHLQPATIDAIITDPPYPKEYIYTFEQLAEQAKTLLKPGGVLVAMAGHLHINTLIDLMTPHLKFHWLGCYYMPTGSHASLPTYSVSVYWKPLLIFSNGKWPKTCTFRDVIINDEADKKYHEWGQGISGFRRIVEAFTMPNDTVLDPFVGGGTTAIAALDAGRYFIGSDISQEEVSLTLARLEEVV